MRAVWKSKALALTPAFVLALVFGGSVTPTLRNPNEPGTLDNHTDDDLRTIIDEGRRQLDNATANFEHVQGRAQSLLTVALAVLGFTAGAWRPLQESDGTQRVIATVLFGAAATFAVLGVAAAAAVIAVRADFDQVDTTQVSNMPSPVLRELALDYASCVKRGEITLATRVTVFRMATRYTVWGAVFTAITYVASS